MEDIKFEATPDEQGRITLPKQFVAKLAGKSVTVIVQYSAKDQDQSDAADTHYTKGYDQKDSLYDAY